MAETAYIDKYKVYGEACAGCWYHGDEVGSCNLSEPCEKLVFAFASAPAADVVEVVRCRDCKMWEKQNIFEHSDTGGMRRVGYCRCSRFTRYEDDFCSSGEHQTNTAENQPTPSGKKVSLFDLSEVQESMEGNPDG